MATETVSAHHAPKPLRICLNLPVGEVTFSDREALSTYANVYSDRVASMLAVLAESGAKRGLIQAALEGIRDMAYEVQQAVELLTECDGASMAASHG